MDRACDICVIGGGPAGTTLATRLAGFGWKVCLVERALFPRRHLGESLTPGVLPLLASIGAGPAIERAGYPRVRKVNVRWEADWEREEPEGQGMLVDRGHFDRTAPAARPRLRGARAATGEGGTPAAPRRRLGSNGVAGRPHDRTGDTVCCRRFGPRRGSCRRRQTGPRTLALYAYWSGDGLPRHPQIEASADRWYWSVPLPDGLYNTLVFLDPRDLRARSSSLEERFHELIASSSSCRPE